VFFNTTGTSNSHVGNYLGDERFIHAPSRRTGRVMVSALGTPYWAARLDDLRRPGPSDDLAPTQ
jgi:cell wall-associated NlpC family hydrolase